MSIRFSRIKKYNQLEKITIEPNIVVFHGDFLDERGELIISYMKSFQTTCIKFVFDDNQDSFSVNGINIRRPSIKIDEFIGGETSLVLIEATTLGYVEIVTLLFLLNQLNYEINVKIFYAEPEGYRKKEKNFYDDIYELSDEYKNYKYIKPFIFRKPQDSLTKEKATLITILGFEGNRLGRIIEDNDADLKYDEFISIVSIPGFAIGMENISLSKHYHLLDNVQSLHYAPADNPYETYKTLNMIVDNLSGKKVAIMPIGTKPCTIGTSVYMVNKYEEAKKSKDIQKISTKYDFPIKTRNRTYGISYIYEYDLKVN